MLQSQGQAGSPDLEAPEPTDQEVQEALQMKRDFEKKKQDATDSLATVTANVDAAMYQFEIAISHVKLQC